ncbi:MAG: helix-turn-helix domain-containing protein [Gallionella sp.]|jgi:transcriptional regulator GlxA family with amidase domain|nr:helix-turn-helix domain-containing protein [Gallionella sp.]MCK9355187.1 helix-turn-helix domain-containing protein [Gallionella sp.]
MKIALLLEEGSTSSSVATTLDMFRLAQRFQPDAGWQPHLFSTHGGPVRLTDALLVETHRLPADLGGYDAIILPGFFAESVERIAESMQTTWRGVIARLQKLPGDTLVAASCYGTFVLAEAGLLDGVPATTTWWFAEAFHQRYPQVQLDADKTLVDSGRAITAGAMTAHTDLALHVLRRLGGVALARNVSGIMLVDGARTSQRPFMSVQKDYSEPLIRDAIAWMEKHLAQPVAIDELASAMHVSYRTLNRRFVEITGMTPLAYLQALKIERAKELLEVSRADFETITEKVGYGDASSFRRLFKRATGLSPMQYRRQFKAKP